ncbi:MAG: sigma-70 family RNA polymerase sigma factor [Planctomycetota bacterium]
MTEEERNTENLPPDESYRTGRDNMRAADSIGLLIDRARTGCDSSREKLLDQLSSFMAHMAASRMNPAFQAKFGESDVVQQTLAVAIEKFEDFRGKSEGELLAWIKQILRNQILMNQRSLTSHKRDMFREQPIISPDSSIQPTHFPVDRHATPGTEAVRNEYSVAVRDALKLLPEDYRQVIQFRNWDKLSFPEIARRMNRSANAVTKLWYRALIELRKKLGDQDE